MTAGRRRAVAGHRGSAGKVSGRVTHSRTVLSRVTLVGTIIRRARSYQLIQTPLAGEASP